MLEAVLLGASVFVGAAAQRVTGLGFALIAAPFLTLAAGPLEGIAVTNALAILLAASVLLHTWRDVDWRRVGVLFLAAVPGIAAGTFVILHSPPAIALIVIGCVVIVGVRLVMRGVRLAWLRGARGAIISGAASGFMNAAAGVGGPVLAIHSDADGWGRRVFIATAQAYFLLTNALSLGLKGVPTLAPSLWIVAITCLAGGVVLGSFIAPRVPARHTRRVLMLIALAAGVVTFTKGVSLLLG